MDSQRHGRRVLLAWAVVVLLVYAVLLTNVLLREGSR
jgi:hypothetical protein